jgi:hypothetical protein
VSDATELSLRLAREAAEAHARWLAACAAYERTVAEACQMARRAFEEALR